jgi:hypothetical protein
MNAPALGAAAAAAVLVVAHGGVGHGWHRMQLRRVELAPTALVGDAESARRFFEVCWHMITVFFTATAIALAAIGLGKIDPHTASIALRFTAATYLGIAAVAGAYFATRVRAIARPIPAIASTAMVAVIVLSWIAA